jgi:predicted ATPase
MLKIIRISNFKSISDEPILLENFNVLIGPNAAGKSNFVDIFRFIFDVVQGRLSSAIGRRLGWENTLTREKNKNEKIKVEIFCNIDENRHIILNIILKLVIV